MPPDGDPRARGSRPPVWQHGGVTNIPRGTLQEQTFYEQVGGEADLPPLVHRFYEGVADDPLLRPMYPEEDLGPAEERLTLFLMQYWGGPRTYSDNRGHPRLRMRHAPFPVDRPRTTRGCGTCATRSTSWASPPEARAAALGLPHVRGRARWSTPRADPARAAPVRQAAGEPAHGPAAVRPSRRAPVRQAGVTARPGGPDLRTATEPYGVRSRSHAPDAYSASGCRSGRRRRPPPGPADRGTPAPRGRRSAGTGRRKPSDWAACAARSGSAVSPTAGTRSPGRSGRVRHGCGRSGANSCVRERNSATAAATAAAHGVEARAAPAPAASRRAAAGRRPRAGR